MEVKTKARIGLAAALAALGGTLIFPQAAAAAQWNSVSMYYAPSGFVWENYTRSHTGTSDIKFDMNDSASDFRSGDVALKYDSNGRVFAQKSVGLSSVTLVSNWGATRFHFGFRGAPATGTVKGSLYY